jgi:hypothetical protein
MRRALIVLAILAIPNSASAAIYMFGNELYEMLLSTRNIGAANETQKDVVSGSIGTGYVTVSGTTIRLPKGITFPSNKRGK